MMKGSYSVTKSFNRCTYYAVAGTSMRIADILDTAIIAVSIIVLRLISLLVLHA